MQWVCVTIVCLVVCIFVDTFDSHVLSVLFVSLLLALCERAHVCVSVRV